MNQPKRHHYVPVMILKHFTGHDGQLHCCLRAEPGIRFWKAQPQNAFVVGHLYTKRDESGNPDMSVEEGLSVVEGDAAAVIDKIISCSLKGDCPCLTAGEREKLGRFIDHQNRRTPEIHKLIDKDLENWEVDLQDRFESENNRPPTTKELAQIKDPELRKRMRQKMIADLAGSSPTDEVLRLFSQCPIRFRVIRNGKKSFVIGSRIKPGDWFPVHQKVAFKLVAANGPDTLTEIRGMAEIRHVNEQTVRDSLAFAGSSEQLVQSLAGSR